MSYETDMAKAGDRLTFLGGAIILDGKIKAAGGEV